MIGLGYYGTITPAVIRRNVLENPAWYTAYTPYQPEICQGRLEALINFQTMVADLTGADVAGASMLDEATAAAEAMTLAAARASGKPRAVFVVDADALPQTLGVLRDPRRAARHRAARRATSPAAADLPDAGASACCCSTRAPAARSATSRAVVDAAHAARRRGRRRRRPARADPARARRASSGADVARRHHPALRRPDGLRRPARRLPGGPRRPGSASCPAAWSASRSTPTATRPTGWRCRPASSTSAGRRRPATSAPRRCCSPSSPPCTRVYHGPDGLTAIAAAGAPARGRRSPPALRDGGARGRARRLLRHRAVRVPGRAGRGRGRRARERPGQPAPGRRRPVQVACDETTDAGAPAARSLAALRASGVGPGRPATTRRRRDALPAALRSPDLDVPHPPGLPAPTAARPRCCATCAACRTRTSRSTGR